MATAEAVDVPPVRPATQLRRFALFALSVLLLAATVMLGYRSGTQANRTKLLTGRGYVGLHEASVQVSGVWYGFTGNIEWTDRSGTLHEDSWPGCLHMGNQTVRFAAVPVQIPQVRWWQVVWVDCRAAQTP